MKLDQIDIPPEKAAALTHLLDRMSASAVARDNSGVLVRTFGVTVKAGSLNVKNRSVRVQASTAALDSYDEIVEQSWRLKRYSANPTVLYNHNNTGLCAPVQDTLPIGHSSDVEASDAGLECTLNFVDAQASPLAEMVWQGFKQGSIRAVSVGFRPHSVRKEKHDDKEIIVLADNELFEISVCPIPANPEAVARAMDRNHERAKRLVERSATPDPATDDDPPVPLSQVLERSKPAGQGSYPLTGRSVPSHGGKPSAIAERLGDNPRKDSVQLTAPEGYTTGMGPDERARLSALTAAQDARAAARSEIPTLAARLESIK